MKTYTVSILVACAFIIISGCTGGGSNETSTQSDISSVPSSHPMGQASVQDDVSDQNILQVAIGSADHTTLVVAVQAAEIEHILVNNGPLTVFAPTNDAFALLPDGTVEELLKPENKAKLASTPEELDQILNRMEVTNYEASSEELIRALEFSKDIGIPELSGVIKSAEVAVIASS